MIVEATLDSEFLRLILGILQLIVQAGLLGGGGECSQMDHNHWVGEGPAFQEKELLLTAC